MIMERKKLYQLLVLITVAFVFITAIFVIKDKNTPNYLKFKISDIKDVKFYLGSSGGASNECYSFDLKNSKHKKIVSDELNEIRLGRIKTEPIQDGYANSGGSPTYLFIEMKNGDSIQISSTMEFGDSGKLVSVDKEVSVIIKSENKKLINIRIECSKTKKFIEGGWKDYF